MTKKPRFPGFEHCMQMMCSSNGSVSEEGFGWLAERAAEYLPQLIAAFWDDDNAALRPWLVALIAAAKSPAALPFLLERLGDNDESIRDRAVRGLRLLDTKESYDVALHSCRIPNRGVAQHGRLMHCQTTTIGCSMPVEVSSMGARRRLVLPAWTGFMLIVVGFLAFVASYFLLPLYFTACFDPCIAPTYYTTTWDYALNALTHLPVTPVVEAGILVLCYLPLLAAVTVVGCSVGFLVRPRRTLVMWSFRAWLVGSIALGILLLLVLLLPLLSLVRP